MIREGFAMRTSSLLRCGVVLCLFSMMVSCSGSDYLSPDLRARVEQLKAEVAAEPTTDATAMERAQVLWEWANASSLADGVIPVELPSVMARVLGSRGTSAVGAGTLAAVDRYVRELGIRDECPDCIGTLSNDAVEPLPSGSFQTLVQTYTVGSMGMKEGGGILLAQHFMTDSGRDRRAVTGIIGSYGFQRDDPAATDYLTIACSNREARFVDDTVPMTGMHGGFLTGTLDAMVFRLEGTDLAPGDTITITYGDTSGGSRGFQVQSYANDFFPLPVYVDLEAGGDFFTLPIQPYAIRGTDAFAVHGFAPSVVGVGESFEISVRTEDRLYNRATNGAPEYEVLVNGEPHSSIPADEAGLTVLENLAFDESGVYRFSFRSPDGAVTGESNPIWVREDPKRRIYWGELHAHGGFAEGLGTPEWFFRFAKEDARLDFVSLSEHDVWMVDQEWRTMQEFCDRYTEQGEFIAFLGYEWTVAALRGGHHNVFFRTSEGRERVGLQRAPTLSELYFQLRQENDLDDVLIIPHAHTPGDWRVTDPDLEKLIEIMSMHGHFEWFGQRYLSRGYEMGFIAASDDHLSHPGYTGTLAQGLFQRGGLAAAIAPSKTSDAIFDSLRSLSAYATTGERIILDLELNGEPMGSRAAFDMERRIRGRIIGTSPIDTVAFVKNGTDVWTKDYLTMPRPGRFVQVDFESSSEEHFREAPRGYRYWTGTLTVTGARLVSFDTPQFASRYAEFARLDPQNPNRIHFLTGTRGKASSILLELADVSPGAGIVIELDEAREVTSTPQIYRRPAAIPAATVRLPFRSATAGRLRREFRVERYTDSITLRFVDPSVPADRSFEFVDLDPVTRGDYYYLRVRQLDGAMAWSSPIWVGGVPPT
jgi:hypothetical protein